MLMNNDQILNSLRNELLTIDKIKEFTKGNVYLDYLDEFSLFPCITIYFMLSKTREGKKSISLQVKAWMANAENAKKELLSIYDVLYDYFDTRKKDEFVIQELFQGKYLFESNTENPYVETVSEAVEEKVLEEKINEIEVFSLPLVLSTKGIKVEPEVEMIEKVG